MYKETHTKEDFHQGLKVGSTATFMREGEKYTGDGWEQIPVRCIIKGFDYPFIHTSNGTFHYSRYKKDTQLELFN
jgi:hypothetical protein